MTELAAEAFVAVAPSDAIPNEFAAACYLAERKLRVCVRCSPWGAVSVGLSSIIVGTSSACQARTWMTPLTSRTS